MIVVRLNGGLGNQLFQFSAGYALALKNRDTLKLDLSALTNSTSNQTIRQPDILEFIGVSGFERATSIEIKKFRKPYGFFSKLFRAVNQKLLKKYYHDWHPEIMNLKGNIYLEGYFQAEHYFKDIYTQLINELSVSDQIIKNTLDISQIISSKMHPVSIHIRRGDYITNPDAKKFHDICTKEYFYKAIDYLEKEIGKINLLVFSDDIAWVKNNMKWTTGTVFISALKGMNGKALTGPEELYLMSICEHNIISNSTFSWWGAYLNKNKTKKVVAPNIWNKSPFLKHKNIIPNDWTRLPI